MAEEQGRSPARVAELPTSLEKRAASRRSGAELIVDAVRPSAVVALEAATTVRDAMQAAPRTVAPETSLAALEALFAEGTIEALAVVEADGALLGLVTVEELWRARLAGSAEPCAEALMRVRLPIARPEWPLALAGAVMARHRVPALPVVSASGTQLLGMLGRQELLAWMARRCGYPVEAAVARASSA
jgi:CBS domain-containing protein